MIVKCDNGIEIKFGETPRYYKLTAGNKTWYWDRETGEYDGTSIEIIGI
jgi:hypothetical protein